MEAPDYLQEVIAGENEIFLESLKQTKAEMVKKMIVYINCLYQQAYS